MRPSTDGLKGKFTEVEVRPLTFLQPLGTKPKSKAKNLNMFSHCLKILRPNEFQGFKMSGFSTGHIGNSLHNLRN